MTRKEQYCEWKEISSRITTLKEKKRDALAKGDAAFNELQLVDRELAYEKAGDDWEEADVVQEEIAALQQRHDLLLSFLEKHEFPFDDYESIGSYGISLKRKVKVTFLDGREEVGLIYAWTYDNPDDYYLHTASIDTIDLSRGWEIDKIEILEIL